MSELLEEVFSIYPARPNVAILMSGSGSNAQNLLTNPEVRDHYDITTIVTDNKNSNAIHFAEEYGLAYVERHIDKFRSKEEREVYFDKLSATLGSLGVSAAFYAGFMKVSSEAFARNFPGVNVHPADLTIVDENGIAIHRGMHALSTMRKQTNGLLAASVHVVDNPVDTGSVFAVSDSIACESNLSDQECHRLLQVREHVVYPAALVGIANGTLKRENMPVMESEL